MSLKALFMYGLRDDYQRVLEFLLDREWLQGDAVIGIARRAINQGIESLTEKQKSTLEQYAFKPFDGFDMDDLFRIHDMGYDGTDDEILKDARELKDQLGYIPDENSREEDYGYRQSM